MKPLDTILKGFTKTIQALEKLASNDETAAGFHREHAATLLANANDLEGEAQQARRIAENLKTLLQGDKQ
ncbi:hypothetical protein [Ectopseudomonas toyotomiensis]|jgi:ABC-type transporter Mla subunit MlaD|uniref:hypothetical protein n=1 Tax=Ectopseudomonas toyotomiensis TaxID=554344 RepID=UPI0018C3B12A|nr:MULTISPECIES: hypothetical protein [Pseudomonas]MBG0843208.1 hypothetical protein [Pseudomonas toyotomiensis]MBG0846645.1 hypothetical protein [Pseudomonas chengduensis]